MKRHTSVLAVSSLRSRLLFGAPLALSLAGALSACAEAEPRDLGFTQSAQDLATEPTEPFFEDATQFAGRWVGSAAETLALSDGSTRPYTFPSGSSSIVVELEIDEFNNLVGSITFGEGAPLPPATDPDVGYPAGVAYDDLLGYSDRVELPDGTQIASTIPTHLAPPPFEGVAYALSLFSGYVVNDDPVQVADGVASLRFNSFAPLEGWCELQTPYEFQNSPGLFTCIPDHGGGLETLGDGSGALCDLYGPPIVEGCLADFSNLDECYQQGEVVEQVNCDKATMCVNNLCECNSGGCFANSSSNDRLTVRRVGDELVGLIENTNFKNARGLSTPLGEVRFQRVQ
jgi:hypothetical protein